VFRKEYETFDWVYEMIEDKVGQEEISREKADELIEMIDDNTPLEDLIAELLNAEII
jgi:hypothetical protein